LLLLTVGACSVAFTIWKRVFSCSSPAITCLPPKYQWRECSEFDCAMSKISTSVGSRWSFSVKSAVYISTSASSKPRPSSAEMRTSASRPSAASGIVRVGAAVAPSTPNVASGASYTASVIRSWSDASAAARCAADSGDAVVSLYRRDCSTRATWVSPHAAQIESAFEHHAVENDRRGPTSRTSDAPRNDSRAVAAGSKVSARSQSSRRSASPSSSADSSTL
jgi:hypothetical protein